MKNLGWAALVCVAFVLAGGSLAAVFQPLDNQVTFVNVDTGEFLSITPMPFVPQIGYRLQDLDNGIEYTVIRLAPDRKATMRFRHGLGILVDTVVYVKEQ